MKSQKSFVPTMVIVLIFMAQFISSCSYADPLSIKGSGNKVSENRQISSFVGLDVSGGFEVVLTQGSQNSVSIEADDNLMKEIITEVRGGELNIYTKGNVYPSNKMIANITFVNLEDIDISGAVKVTATNNLKFNRLTIDGSGASNVNFTAEMNALDADFSGASTVNLSGKANQLSVECSGASKLYLSEFQTESASLELSGASYAEVWVTEKLSIEASGASDVRYKGEPKDINSDTSGASKVRKL
jgi:hypothetical protein